MTRRQCAARKAELEAAWDALATEARDMIAAGSSKADVDALYEAFWAGMQLTEVVS